MKSLMWRSWVPAAVAVCVMLGRPSPANAQEPGGLGDRLERLEMRMNDMAEHQEHLVREMGGQMERMREMARTGREGKLQPLPPEHELRPPLPARDLAPGAKLVKGIADALRFCFFIGIICNILLAIWIFTDIRQRGEGSAIFVAVALLAGVPAALIYAITRIGDKKA